MPLAHLRQPAASATGNAGSISMATYQGSMRLNIPLDMNVARLQL